MRALAAVMLAATLLTACASMERAAPQTEIALPRPGRSSADEIVAYMARLRTLGAAAITGEASRQRQAAARKPTDMARVKAGIALFMAHNGDEAEILTLVEPVSRNDSEDPDLRAMASFLHVLASDRRRLRESAAAKVRDERRAQEQLRSRADSAQERAEQLQQKLDALTALEKSLSDRQPASR